MNGTERPTHYRWNVFVMACGTSWLLYLHRYIFALIKPELIREWHLGKDELGLLDSAFSIFYTGFQLPLGITVDVAGVHIMLTGMIIVWSLGLGMHAWAPSPNYLWSARAVLGIGQSAAFAALTRITRNWFPVSVRTTVQGWVGVFFGRFGGLSANLIVGALMMGVLHLPWRTTVYLMAAVGIVHALPVRRLLPQHAQGTSRVNDAEALLIAEAESVSSGTASSAYSRHVRPHEPAFHWQSSGAELAVDSEHARRQHLLGMDSTVSVGSASPRIQGNGRLFGLSASWWRHWRRLGRLAERSDDSAHGQPPLVAQRRRCGWQRHRWRAFPVGALDLRLPQAFLRDALLR